MLIGTLDTAGDYLEIALKGNKDDKDIADLRKALAQLEITRSLLSMIDSEDKFKTPRVISELPVVGKALNTLVTELNKGKPHSMRRVNNAIDGLKGKTKNLQSLLPGLYVETRVNHQGQHNKYMINAPVVKKLESGQLDGGTFIATGNVADGEIMINSIVETDIDFGKKQSK